MESMRESDPCLCQSGRPFSACCLGIDGITLRPRPACTTPTLPETGVGLPKCYASELCDCDTVLTNEHPKPKSVLELIASGGNKIVVTHVVPGQDRKVFEVSPKSLCSGNLCNRHNGALSGVDAVASRFRSTYDRIRAEFGDNRLRREDRDFLFAGEDIERWMLQELCGMLDSRGLITREWNFLTGKLPIRWLRILFGQEPFPPEWGLYWQGVHPNDGASNRGDGISPLFDADGIVAGCDVQIDDIRFALLLTERERLRTQMEHPCGLELGQLYRPSSICLQNGLCEKVILFRWEDQNAGRGFGHGFHFRQREGKP